jgi:hypothetical protein
MKVFTYKCKWYRLERVNTMDIVVGEKKWRPEWVLVIGFVWVLKELSQFWDTCTIEFFLEKPGVEIKYFRRF